MFHGTTRRAALLGASALAVAAGARPRPRAAKDELQRAFTEQDPRADAYKAFGAAMKNDFELQPFSGNTLFKQGTELVALQRGNLEMANLAPADISKQLPAWSLLTSAYLFRDVAHLKKTFKSDVGRDFIKIARDQPEIEVITPVYFGARHVNLKPDRRSGRRPTSPGHQAAHAAGRVLAVPGRVDRRESHAGGVRRGLHRPADRRHRRPGQPVGLEQADEVRRGDAQFVLTGHVVGFDLLPISSKAWNAIKPEQQTRFRAAAEKAIDDYTAKFEGEQERDDRVLEGPRARRSTRPISPAFRTRAEDVRREVRPRLAERRTREDQRLFVGGSRRRGMAAMCRRPRGCAPRLGAHRLPNVRGPGRSTVAPSSAPGCVGAPTMSPSR